MASLGRLKSMGLSVWWQVAFLLPTDFEDLTAAARSFAELPETDFAPLQCTIAGTPESRFSRGVPRMAVKLKDSLGQVLTGIMYGDTRKVQSEIAPGQRAVVRARRVTLDNGAIVSLDSVVPKAWWGRVRPVYPGRAKVITPATVRQRVLDDLEDALEPAEAFLRQALAPYGAVETVLARIGCPNWTIADLLRQAHTPISIQYGRHAHRALERMAALEAILSARQTRPQGVKAPCLDMRTLDARIAALPMRMTDEQRQASQAIAQDLGRGRPMRRLLVGNPGSGKTCVYAAPLAAAADGGARSAILVPNGPLAEQLERELHAWWPGLNIQVITATAKQDMEVDRAAIIVGTTALLHRETGHLDVVVVDEQQRYSVAQREALGPPQVHRLECSATCLPRSMALASHGAMDVSELHGQHSARNLDSHVWESGQRAKLFDTLAQAVAQDERILVVYPLKTGPDARHAAHAAVEHWESRFPGRVCLLTGDSSDEDKSQALRELREGQARILVATTAVEVGLTIPGLTHVLVIQPERFGMATLHQLRGRLARHGGQGHFHLYASEDISDRARERLRVITGTTDGFRIAEFDLRQRGCGDLSTVGASQSGLHEGFLPLRPLALEAIEAAAELLQEGEAKPVKNRALTHG
jgi:ATP-dependent DNA helicase RecG